MARFFLPQANIQEGRGVVHGQELTHLMKVLRLRAGDFVTVFDNSGWEYEAVIETLTSERGELKIVESHPTGREPSVPITLAVGLTKGEKLDWMIEKATELGVTTVIQDQSRYIYAALHEINLHLVLGSILASLVVLAVLLAAPARPEGQNKIVYDVFDWKTYRSTHFTIYFYSKERASLQKVASFAESAYDDISRQLNFQIPKPIKAGMISPTACSHIVESGATVTWMDC